ncbi:MAG: sigma-70 family RNA polymerase sigma factor [Lachnospiraceae bacterium]|nr:sigma-70 family RNA polymerase sigma factor [Lachnospiraceae bacterium]
MKKEQLGKLILVSEDTLYHVAKSLLARDADCADAIQEAIVKAFTNLHTLRQDSYAKTWLVRILINECYALMRREKHLVSLEEYRYPEPAEESKDYSDLYEAIRRLPPDIRICIILYYLEGYSVKETADILKVTESTVKNRLARARTRMRRELEQAAT